MLVFYILFLLTIDVVLLFLVVFVLVLPVVRGAPFMVSNDTALETILKLADIKPGVKVADLGSGDGKVVIAFAKAGAQVHGYEVNPLLVWWSRFKIRKENLSNKAFVHYRSFWHQSLREFDIVTVYGITRIMRSLEKKLQGELKPRAKVISNVFTFPNWKPASKVGLIYLYVKDNRPTTVH